MFFIYVTSVVNLIFTIATCVVMWKYRGYVKYFYFNSIVNCSFILSYLTAIIFFMSDQSDMSSCSGLYVNSQQLKQFISIMSSTFPAAFRFFDSDFRSRFYRTITSKLDEPVWTKESGITLNLLASSFAIGDKSEDLMRFSKMSLSGIYKSLTAKFIIDSLIGLSIAFKPMEPITRVAIAKKDHETVYDFVKCSSTLQEMKLAILNADCENIRLVEYEPSLFKAIRQSEGVTDEDIAKALDPRLNADALSSIAGKKGGGSGSFLFCTHDSRFMLKTIPTHEKISFLSEMLTAYSLRLLTKQSMIVRIYGVYLLCVGNYSISLVLMDNIVHQSGQISYKFDLKGSVYKRKVLKDEEEPTSKVMKDVDFNNVLRTLSLDKQSAQMLKERLEKDVKMLEDLGIMDYSLLVIVAEGNEDEASKSNYFVRKGDTTNDYYMIALIDFMQQFNTNKRLESWFKRVIRRVEKSDLSAVEPHLYARRFLRYIENILGSFKDDRVINR